MIRRVLVGCECSGRVREALRRRGIDAWSCDTQEAEDGSEFHIRGDVLAHLDDGWDGAIFHPECTYLSLSGVQWLWSKEPSAPDVLKGRDRWLAMFDAAAFYLKLRNCKIPRKVLENPRMHGYAQHLLGYPERQEVQPHHFGEPFLKATGFELINVPKLIRTHHMDVPNSKAERSAIDSGLSATRRLQRKIQPTESGCAAGPIRALPTHSLTRWCGHSMKTN